jgi:hypothetical protein
MPKAGRKVKGKKNVRRPDIDEEDENIQEDDDLLNMGADNVPGMD